MLDECKYDPDFYEGTLRNIILYTHFNKPTTINGAMRFLENKMGYTQAPIEQVCNASETPCYCVVVDDALTETRALLDFENIYFAVIGRGSVVPSLFSTGIDMMGGLSVSHTMSFIGTNDLFLPIRDIPKNRRLNHGWIHWRVPFNHDSNPVNPDNPATLTRKDWWNILAWHNETDNGLERPFHCTSYGSFASEFMPLKGMVDQKGIVVLPFNAYTFEEPEKNRELCEWALNLDIECVIGQYAISTYTGHPIAKRICLDKGLNELLLEFNYTRNTQIKEI